MLLLRSACTPDAARYTFSIPRQNGSFRRDGAQRNYKEAAPILNQARNRSHIAYRPDLDGLRALAVMAVVAFHLQFRFALGGFTGVDVFFTLSGYLITAIILADLHAGRFTLREFYVRRIRRIYPALAAALVGTAIAAWYFCLPVELRDFARSLIAASLSASNLYFGTHSSYFDPLSLSRPALQTWSLGVEEQFYLLFPPTLLLLRRFASRRLPLALAILAALSFVASCVQAFRAPTLAFFMPWTRACELLLGSLLATGAIPRAASAALRNAAAVLGLLLIGGSVLFINGAVPFPGFAALAPCGGAALLIWSGGGGGDFIGRRAPARAHRRGAPAGYAPAGVSGPPLLFAVPVALARNRLPGHQPVGRQPAASRDESHPDPYQLRAGRAFLALC